MFFTYVLFKNKNSLGLKTLMSLPQDLFLKNLRRLYYVKNLVQNANFFLLPVLPGLMLWKCAKLSRKVYLHLSVGLNLDAVLDKSRHYSNSREIQDKSPSVSGKLFILPLAGSSLSPGLQIFSLLIEENAPKVSEGESAGCFMAETEPCPVVLCDLMYNLRTRWCVQLSCLQTPGLL